MYFNTSRKIILSSVLGNALETYDSMTWKLFLVFLCQEFLPPGSSVSDMLFLFLIVSVIRPFASILGGMLADKMGRKLFLVTSIFFMGISTALVSILPSYDQVGLFAIFLLLSVKVLQLFAGGGEYVNSLSLLIESCDRDQRGYFGSWVEVGLNVGTLLSSLVGALILYSIDTHWLPSWGWRLAFILALINMAAGLWIRRSIPESREFISHYVRNGERSLLLIWGEIVNVLRQRPFESFLIFVLLLFMIAIETPILVYFPLYLVTVNTFSSTQAFLINACALSFYVVLIPFMGSLSDKYGRIHVLLIGSILLLFFIVPYFSCLKSGSLFQVLCFHCLMTIPCSTIVAVVPVFMTEIFPISVRCSVANIICSVAVCLGGGVIPIITMKLVEHGDYSPSPIIIAFGLMSTVALLLHMKANKVKTPQLVLVTKTPL